jgi:release factor glutamine methyltransferase
MRVGDAIQSAAHRLTASASPRLDAQLLLSHATGYELVALLAHPERELSASQETAFELLVERRAAAEPIAYLVGEREFYGHVFRVDRRALIPRPETERLVDLGLDALQRFRTTEPRIIEVGTGSGAVAVSLALAARCHVIATDVSYEALTLAGENAQRLHASVALVQADLVEALRGPVHIMLANLPYVPRVRQLPKDVRDYEPHLAIFGGPTGTELIERLLDDARRVLEPGAELAVELDEEQQAQPVAALARSLYPNAHVTIRQDNSGYDRVVHVQTAWRG